MASENESFNLEDLQIFLYSVLEKAEFICHEEVIDGFEQCGNTFDCSRSSPELPQRTVQARK